MTREEEIMKAARVYANGIAQHLPNKKYCEEDFIAGAEWADEHPHWISVEDELPPIGGIVLVAIPLGGELSVLPLSIKNESDFECLSGMTHWMPLPQPPKKGGEK
jgi:hypothetical protein